jgi:hypothetical protein
MLEYRSKAQQTPVQQSGWAAGGAAHWRTGESTYVLD